MQFRRFRRPMNTAQVLEQLHSILTGALVRGANEGKRRDEIINMFIRAVTTHPELGPWTPENVAALRAFAMLSTKKILATLMAPAPTPETLEGVVIAAAFSHN